MPRVRALALFLVAARLAAPTNAFPQRPTEASGSGRAVAAALRARALELGYNLDYDEALAAFDQAIAADPTDPTAHRLAAATVWIHALFRQGAITADDYLGQAKSDVARQPIAPEIAATFQRHIDRALSLAEQRLRDDPLAADSHFQVGAAYGYLTTYKATIEGRVVGGLRTARRAYTENERALMLDPRRRDAGLTVGIYRYTISTLSAPLRLLAGIAGFAGGRERGLR